MTQDNASIVGKPVKDMYGTTFGTVLGILTHIDGSIQTVGIDCGSEGFKQIPYEQFVLQGDVVIYIPGWRIDAQKILREKRLTLRRLKALTDIMSEDDAVKSDTDLIHLNVLQAHPLLLILIHLIPSILFYMYHGLNSHQFSLRHVLT